MPIIDSVIGSGTPEIGDSVPDQVDLMAPPVDSHLKMLPIVTVQSGWLAETTQPLIVPLS